MTVWEWLQEPKPLAVLAGLAGAAAMAVTDFRNPLRLLQHLFVGTVTAAVATPWFYPMISGALALAKVEPAAHAYSAAFITGAFGIYVLEFGLAFWRPSVDGYRISSRSGSGVHGHRIAIRMAANI